MDRLTLARIDDELGSSEVAALCFLCRDVLNKKALETVKDGKDLFKQLDEKDLLSNRQFLSQLLETIKRVDLLSLLEGDEPQTDSSPFLSDYRVMLYNLYEDMTETHFKKMKFLLGDSVGRGQIELCTRDSPVASLPCTSLEPEMRPHSDPSSSSQSLSSDADADANEEPVFHEHQEYYTLRCNPRGTCLVINNEHFFGGGLKDRSGTQQDEKSLRRVFGKLGFQVEVRSDLTAGGIRSVLEDLGKRSFVAADVLVVCVLSHGDKECVFGTDGLKVALGDMQRPFTSERAPTLAAKPKLFFIQACQGSNLQRGSVPCPPRPQEQGPSRGSLEEDAGPLPAELVAEDADFLMGMSTVQDCKSFRNTSTGSIFIQELCRQLLTDDLLSTLTRVNREVSKGDYLNSKQTPQPMYTLTKKLVLTEMTIVEH
ncbi:hypothetical protein NHX12_004322 [Muraenolepis orangiensis]|uniref:Caspase-8 n=1 Tax=Muraenolepis orangiensis TaxID=630683 RepID=A0A9Q0IC33_9TELE|nr:hypothetical protein NHX12_004322 [Muraenolepis orangiensis]